MANTDKFNSMAKSYDSEDKAKITKLFSQEIKKVIGNPKSIMDFGCGTGLVGINLIENYEKIIFVDSAPNMIEVVKNKTCSFDNVETICIDLEYTDLEIKVDCIILSQVLLHIPDYVSLIRKMYAMLNENGQIIIIDFVKNHDIKSDLVHNGFETSQLKEVLEDIGFNSVDSKVIYFGEKMFMKEDAHVFMMHGIK